MLATLTEPTRDTGARSRGHSAMMCGAAIAVMASMAPIALAQDAEPAEVAGIDTERTFDRVIVTARKRAEDIQDTPIAITAVTGAELQRRGVADLTDIAAYAPNVDISSSPSGAGGGGNSQITIRGVGQQDFLVTTDPGVGVYVDGIYFARSTGGVLDIVGLERAEVLRGPQGTLFGRNTIGGAISLVSARPSADGGGFGELTVGSFNRVDVRGGFDLSIIDDTLLSNVSFVSRNADGYSDRLVAEDELGDVNSTSAKSSILYTPSASVEVLLSADYSRARESSAATTSIGEFNPGAGLVGLYNGPANVPGFLGTAPFTDPSTGSFFSTNGTGPNRNDSDVYGVSGTLDWDLSEDLSLRSITAYRGQQVAFGRDGDNSPLTIRETDNTGKQFQFSQELQLIGSHFDDRLQWVGGLFFFDETAKDFNEIRLVSGLFDALESLPAPFGPPGATCAAPFLAPGCAGNPANIGLDLEFDTNLRVENETVAAFAHATYDLTDSVSLNVGGRYTEDEKSVDSFAYRINSGAIMLDETASETFDNFSGKIGLDVKLNEDVLVYGSFSQGFKAGGFNGRALLENELTSFDPETLDAFELGVKSEWMDGRLIANGAVFFNAYTDIQLTAVIEAPDGSLVVSVDNAGEAEAYGAELELEWRPTKAFELFAAVGYLDTEYTDIGSATTITTASEFVKAPEWTTNLIARYTAPLGEWGEVVFQGDWAYRADIFNDVQNSPEIAQDAYSLFNARIALEPANSDWTFAVFGRNIGDEEYIVNGVSAGAFGISEAVVGRPQEWGVSVGRTF